MNTSLLQPTVQVGQNLFGLLVSTRTSIFAFGAEKTGKTIFRKRLQGFEAGKIINLREILSSTASTITFDPAEIVLDVRMGSIVRKVKISYLDVGGDQMYERSREDRIREQLPLGMLLFLDHQTLTTKGTMGEQTDDGKLDAARIERHHQVFRELESLLQKNEQVRESCEALVVVVNKNELWRKGGHTIETFQQTFNDDFQKLWTVAPKIKKPPFMECSGYTGDGIQEVLQKMCDLAARRYFLNYKLPKIG